MRWLPIWTSGKNSMSTRLSDPSSYWGEVASAFWWAQRWDTVVQGEMPDTRWFDGGKTNVCFNCVDRHVADGHGAEVGLVWEGEPIGDQGPEIRRLTWSMLQEEVSRTANALRDLGVEAGDVVTIYMGMVPELAITMLACALESARCTPSFLGALVPLRLQIGSRMLRVASW